MRTRHLSRRAMLAATAGWAAWPGIAVGQGGPVLRMAALDWTLGATALELGVPPVAFAEQNAYRRWVEQPALPSGTIELGLRTQPSLEGLAELRPDLILINELNAAERPALDRIAPTFVSTVFGPARAPLAGAKTVTASLGARLGAQARARDMTAACDLALAQAGGRVPTPWRARPLLPVSVVDARHLLFYGSGSLFDDVLVAMGLHGGWEGGTSPWGTSVAGLDAIASQRAADLLVVEPVPRAAEPLLAETGLLHRLAAARGRRVLRLPAAWPFGGLSAAVRFATGVADALAGAPPA